MTWTDSQDYSRWIRTKTHWNRLSALESLTRLDLRQSSRHLWCQAPQVALHAGSPCCLTCPWWITPSHASNLSRAVDTANFLVELPVNGLSRMSAASWLQIYHSSRFYLSCTDTLDAENYLMTRYFHLHEWGQYFLQIEKPFLSEPGYDSRIDLSLFFLERLLNLVNLRHPLN